MVTLFQQDVDITACTSGRGQLVIGGKLLKSFCLIALIFIINYCFKMQANPFNA